MVICLEHGANDLHMFQLMPLPPRHLLLHYHLEWFSLFWCRLTQVFLEKRPLNRCLSVCLSCRFYCLFYDAEEAHFLEKK